MINFIDEVQQFAQQMRPIPYHEIRIRNFLLNQLTAQCFTCHDARFLLNFNILRGGEKQ